MTAKNVETTAPERARREPAEPQAPSATMSVIAPALGWLIPGAGHIIQRRWVRGALLMVAILTMFILGLLMQGKVYSPNTGDILDVLGFIGDICAGGLYIATKAMDFGQGAISRAVADYGTKFIIVSGLLNVLSIVDAYHIAIGKKK